MRSPSEIIVLIINTISVGIYAYSMRVSYRTLYQPTKFHTIESPREKCGKNGKIKAEVAGKEVFPCIKWCYKKQESVEGNKINLDNRRKGIDFLLSQVAEFFATTVSSIGVRIATTATSNCDYFS